MKNVEQGPGYILSRARESLRMSPADVARQLNLKLHYVQSIEADAYDVFPAIAFVRGYLRAYANLVRVPADDVIKVFNQLGIEEKISNITGQVITKKTEMNENSTRWVTYTVILLFLMLFLMWWRTESKSSHNHNLPTPQVNLQTAPAIPAPPISQTTPVLPSPTGIDMSE